MLSSHIIEEAQEYMLQHPPIPPMSQEEATREIWGGWLIHDYRRSNPIFWQLLGKEIGMVTRPCFLFVPVSGEPRLLVHHVDAGKFQEAGLQLMVYRDRRAMLESLGSLLPLTGPVAMEYSPLGAIPRASKVDAGTVEVVRSLGVEVVSSADLLQYATQCWSQAQVSSHLRSAERLGRIVLGAFEYIGQNLAERPTEYQVADFIRAWFVDEGLHSLDGPIVAINEHASDPHYEPSAEGSSIIQEGDWVLIDLWAKAITEERAEDSVYADITWVAYVGDQVPEKHQGVFQVVTTARDSALKYLESSARQGITLQGCQVDRLAREYITRQGYGDYFTHRLGHSISHEVHGDAVNLDSFETEDTRSIIPGICFSIEPGIYLPEFGVRSEIDVYMSEEGPFATTPRSAGHSAHRGLEHFFHVASDFIEVEVLDRHLRGPGHLVRGPTHCTIPLCSDAHDAVEHVMYIFVHAEGVGLDWLRDSPIFNEVRVADHGTAEVPGSDAVDGVGIPDAAYVEAITHHAKQLIVGGLLLALY